MKQSCVLKRMMKKRCVLNTVERILLHNLYKKYYYHINNLRKFLNVRKGRFLLS